jgi:hypothetical protein
VKRLSKVILVSLLLAVLVVGLLPQMVFASTIVDDAVLQYTIGSTNPQKRSFYNAGNGFYYTFYIDSTSAEGIKYRYNNAIDGSGVWSVAVATTNCITSTWFGVDLYQDKIYLVYGHKTSPYGLWFVEGNFNTNGTITWGTHRDMGTTYGTDGYNIVDVAISSTGYPFVASAGAHTQKCIRSARTVAQIESLGWSTAEVKDILDGGATNDEAAVVLALTSGKIAYVFAPSTLGKVGVRVYNGGWESTKHSAQLVWREHAMNAVAQGDVVHIVYSEANSYGDMYYTKFDASTSSFTVSTKLKDDVNLKCPVITRATDTNNLYVFYPNSATEKIYIDAYDVLNDTWYLDNELLTEGSGLGIDYMWADALIPTNVDHLGLFYLAGSNNILKFKYLGDQFHVDTLAPSSVTETTATLQGDIVTISWGTPTVRGIYWDTVPSLGNSTGTLQHWSEAGTFGIGVFSHTASGFIEGEGYYCIAYATNAETAWGEWVEFNPGGTSGWAVITLPPDPVGDFEATFRGNITELAGTYATVEGFQWGYTATPTWSWEDTGNFTVGVFNHEAEVEADSIYYVRAYAGNSTVVDYGQWIGFITHQPSYVTGPGSDYSDLFTGPVPTTAPGGWVRTGKTYDGFPIISPIINAFADLGFGRSFFWFTVEVFLIVVLTLIGARFTRNLPITFLMLLVLFLLPFIAFEYLDWWMFAPYLLVGGALCIKEGQFSWS